MKKVKTETTYEMPRKSADIAQKSVDQAQAAFDKASELAHGNVQALDAAAGAFKSRALDIQMKSMEIAQTNVNAIFSFVRQAFAIKDPMAFVSLNQEFARDQFAALSKQASELSELSILLAKETTRPVQQGVMKSFGDWTKPFAA